MKKLYTLLCVAMLVACVQISADDEGLLGHGGVAGTGVGEGGNGVLGTGVLGDTENDQPGLLRQGGFAGLGIGRGDDEALYDEDVYEEEIE